MHQNLHDLGFKVPGLARFFYRVDLRLDQPVIDAEIPLHQLYLTKWQTSLQSPAPTGFTGFPPHGLSNSDKGLKSEMIIPASRLLNTITIFWIPIKEGLP